MEKKKFFTVRRLAIIGVMSAIIFVLTKFVSIPIPTPVGKTAVHLGNAMCLLSGMLFGPLTGGISAGLGSMLVDLTDPIWAPEFWMTFINKFAMAFFTGLFMKKAAGSRQNLHLWLSGISGSLIYCALYLLKEVLYGHIVQGFAWNIAIAESLTLKLPVTLINAALATVCAALFYLALHKSLEKAHLLS